MRNIIKILTVLFLATSYSCSSDWLDVSPSDGLSKDQAINNLADAKVALTGVYDAIQGNSDANIQGPSYYGARMIYFGDVRGDDMQAREATGRTGPSYVMNYTITGEPQIWLAPYRLIRRANNLITAIDEGRVSDAAQADQNDLKGQALAIRALAHFDLVRVYSLPYYVTKGAGLGIPIVLRAESYDFVAGRNSIDEVYTQVIKDLTESISLMKSSKSLGYFNTWAAKALLARVYLYKGDNENAYKTALDVINNSPYSLWKSEEYTSAWAKAGTSEVLFEIVNYDTDDWVDRESIGYLYAEDGYADALMTNAFVDLVATKYPKDVRQGVMLRSNLPDADAKKEPWGLNKVYINKYPGREGFDDIRVNNISILRLSEVYLIAAEAAAKLSDGVSAAKYLNAIVLRGNPDATPVSASEATLDRILQENRIEFVGEGHRFFDLMRNGKEVVRYTNDTDMGWHLPLSAESRKFDVNYFRVILPIPDNEVRANPLIREQQNPGY